MQMSNSQEVYQRLQIYKAVALKHPVLDLEHSTKQNNNSNKKNKNKIQTPW